MHIFFLCVGANSEAVCAPAPSIIGSLMKKTALITLVTSFTLAGISVAAAAMPPSAEQQKALTAQAVLDDLMAGNVRFVAGQPNDTNTRARIETTSTGQFPKAYILSCVDSRVPVEQVFDQGIGDIFVGRVAGNIESAEQLGSMEFATAAAGAKLVMVLGHEACGAVKGACDGVELGNLTALLEQIGGAVEAVPGFDADRTSKNHGFVEAVIEKNVQLTVADIRKRSPVLAGMEEAGDIKIVGALYSLQSGQVTLVE